MNWLDITILVLVLVPVFIGFRRGLIGTLAPLLGVLLSIILAGRYYASLGGFLSQWLESPTQAKIAGFIILFLLVMATVVIISSIVRRFLNLLLLGWVDKAGGLVFGLLIGAFIVGAILSLAIKFFPSGLSPTVNDSALAAFFVDKFPVILYLLPREFDSVRHFFG